MKSRFQLIIVILVIFSVAMTIFSASRQVKDSEWGHIWGTSFGDYGKYVQQTSDGGYIVMGDRHTRPQNSEIDGRDVWLIKLNEQGKVEWEQTFNNPGGKYNSFSNGQQTTDGGYIFTGGTSEKWSNSMIPWLVKTDASGEVVWERTYQTPECRIGYFVQQTLDYGYVLVTSTFSGSGEEIVMLKTDSQGELEWEKVFYELRGQAYCVRQTSDGGYIITGERDGSALLLKTDDRGKLLWEKSYGGKLSGRTFCVQQVSDRGYVLAGYRRKNGEPGLSPPGDLWLIRTDSDGKELWNKSYGSDSGYDVANCVQETTDGGFVVTGQYTSGSNSESQLWLIKTNDSGDIIWEKRPVRRGCDGYWVEQTLDGGYIVTGDFGKFRPSLDNLYRSDLWVFKVKPD
jgi:hypothetical protein